MITASTIWPRAISLSVSFNDHANVYETAERWLENNGDILDWPSPEEKAKAIAENSIWVIHWYPDTPIGFYSVAASTFDAALAFAMSNGEAK